MYLQIEDTTLKKGHFVLLHTTFPQMPTLMCSNKDTCIVPKVSNIQKFHCVLQDDLVDYHIKNERFPGRVKKVDLPTTYLPDIIVLMWVCLLGVPAVFTALYLAWVGAWLTLGVILAAIFVGMQLSTSCVLFTAMSIYTVYVCLQL